jgi:hypothetical protein
MLSLFTVCKGFLFPPLCTIFTSAPFTVSDTGTIKDAANDMVPHAGQVADTASANQNCAMLLEIVVDARYVSREFLAIGQSNAGNFSQGGVRLLRRHSPYDKTHPPFLGRAANIGYSFAPF